MKEFFQENKRVILIVVCGLTLLPIIISVAMFFPLFKLSKGDANSWLSFWGSYLGGIFSGVMTFLGVFMAFKLERENNKRNHARRNYKKTFEVFKWTDELLKYLNGGKKESALFYLQEKGQEILEYLADIDSEWYLEAKYIHAEVYNTWLNKIDTIESKKSDIERLHRDVIKYIGK